MSQFIFELDGCLVDTSAAMGLQGDWEAYNAACLTCPANRPVAALARVLQQNMELVVLMARPASAYQATLAQLQGFGIVPEALLHRPDFNHEPALELIKTQMAHAMDYGLLDEPLGGITASAKVAELWRSMGILALETTQIVEVG